MPSHALNKSRRFPSLPSSRQGLLTLSGSLATFFWYACPDFVTTKKARFFTRLATLLGLGSIVGVVAADTVKTVRRDYTMESPDEEAWEMNSDTVKFSRENLNLPMLVLLFLFGGGIALASIWMELWLFRRGERRRLAGVPLAHTRQAIPLALLFASANLLDDSLSDSAA